MRIKISHETTYAYAPPARSIIQILRLTPRSFEAQYVVRWRISTDIDCTLRQNEDSLGNIVHSFSHAGPDERIAVFAAVDLDGEVERGEGVGAGHDQIASVTVGRAPLCASWMARNRNGSDGATRSSTRKRPASASCGVLIVSSVTTRNDCSGVAPANAPRRNRSVSTATNPRWTARPSAGPFGSNT